MTLLLGKMGQANDPMAVADSTGRVFGVSNLRVADISAFLLLPPGHPQSTVCKCSRYFPAWRAFHVIYLLARIVADESFLAPDMLGEKIAANVLDEGWIIRYV